MIIVPKGIKDLPASWQELYLDLKAEKESEEIFEEVERIEEDLKTSVLVDGDVLGELDDEFSEFESLDSVLEEEDEDDLFDEFDENTHEAWMVDNAENTSGLSTGMRDIFERLDD